MINVAARRIIVTASPRVTKNVPGKSVEDASCWCRFKKAHWRAEDGERHPLMQFAAGLCHISLSSAVTKTVTYLDRAEDPEN